jgi:preprotein translocase subunit SecA
VEITKEGIDLEKEGLRGPSATWTYLVNDTPFGSKLEMFLRPLLKKILKKSSEVL